MTTRWEAAGYPDQESWAAAGWPHPIDPETGRSLEGYKILRIEGGRHPHGRGMTDEDWMDPQTAWLFEYLRTTQQWGNPLWAWRRQMQGKYPGYPEAGVDIEQLLRQMFPQWYEGEAGLEALPGGGHK